MEATISNGAVGFTTDTSTGTLTALYKANDDMNWLINPPVLRRYGYEEEAGKLLGKSMLRCNGTELCTEQLAPTAAATETTGVAYTYSLPGLQLVHRFTVQNDALCWHIALQNTGQAPAVIDRMYHWMPVHYVMHETLAENFSQSCSFVPSVSEDCSYAVCRKRNGKGPDLVIANTGGGFRSAGSLCRYKNLFFEKSAPSLSGLVLMCAVNCDAQEALPGVDWQYSAMRQPIVLQAGETFTDSYRFFFAPQNGLEAALLAHELPLFTYEPVVLCGNPCNVTVQSGSPAVYYTLYRAAEDGPVAEQCGTLPAAKGVTCIALAPLAVPGERKLCVTLADGRTASIVFAVYTSMREMVEGFCHWIYTESFIDDPAHPDACGYRSLSRQGEACAKGSLLLMKNLIGPPVPEEIAQVERNAVYYLRKRWLNEDFTAKKQYPGGFARIIDMDYLILQFYLLAQTEDCYLRLHRADTYLEWAFQTAQYRFSVTPDKLPREAVEVELASMISWLQAEMPACLRARGKEAQAQRMEQLWAAHLQTQLRKAAEQSYVETEHYFDNAGISVFAETLFNGGCLQQALPAAELLLANVAPGTDYRTYAPDRWWEALAPMYHNLWAVFSAKALLTAYEKTGDTRFLQPAYRAMMPMFYNYDWNALSAPNRLKKGMGVSAYCLTSPNLNVPQASRNRFGQSIFKDEFFARMDIAGDDWDLGADMVVYLFTFGQTCYVAQGEKGLMAVNAILAQTQTQTTITSAAAYPTRYCLDAFGLVVEACAPGVRVRTVTLQNGCCTAFTTEDAHTGALAQHAAAQAEACGVRIYKKEAVRHGI